MGQVDGVGTLAEQGNGGLINAGRRRDTCGAGGRDRYREGGGGTSAELRDRGAGARHTLTASSGVERMSSAWSVLSLGLSKLGTNVRGHLSARSALCSLLRLSFSPSPSGLCTKLLKNLLGGKWNRLILARAVTHASYNLFS